MLHIPCHWWLLTVIFLLLDKYIYIYICVGALGPYLYYCTTVARPVCLFVRGTSGETFFSTYGDCYEKLHLTGRLRALLAPTFLCVVHHANVYVLCIWPLRPAG